MVGWVGMLTANVLHRDIDQPMGIRSSRNISIKLQPKQTCCISYKQALYYFGVVSIIVMWSRKRASAMCVDLDQLGKSCTGYGHLPKREIHPARFHSADRALPKLDALTGWCVCAPFQGRR
jgi:hypothetical protein